MDEFGCSSCVTGKDSHPVKHGHVCDVCLTLKHQPAYQISVDRSSHFLSFQHNVLFTDVFTGGQSCLCQQNTWHNVCCQMLFFIQHAMHGLFFSIGTVSVVLNISITYWSVKLKY